MPNDAKPPSSAGLKIVDPTFRGSSRHALGEERVVLKAARRDGVGELVEEWLNEIVSYRLSLRLLVPVPETYIKRMRDGTLRLSSVFMSEIDLQRVPPHVRSQISNIRDLPGLMVLDQLVFNLDRREDHVVLTADPSRYPDARWCAIDHGHTFFGPSAGVLTLDGIELAVLQMAPVRIDYRVTTFADLEPWISRLRAIPDREIEALVDDAAATIIALGIPIDVRARVEFHREVLKSFLRRRRETLPALLRHWCTSNGIP